MLLGPYTNRSHSYPWLCSLCSVPLFLCFSLPGTSSPHLHFSESYPQLVPSLFCMLIQLADSSCLSHEIVTSYKWQAFFLFAWLIYILNFTLLLLERAWLNIHLCILKVPGTIHFLWQFLNKYCIDTSLNDRGKILHWNIKIILSFHYIT